jgi:hypothetical protein
MISLGFTYDLNYAFVLLNSTNVAQILSFLPSSPAVARDTPSDEVVMQYLQSRDTSTEVGSVTTLALMWIPTRSLSALRLRLLDPNSCFFQNSEPSRRALVQSIDFTISEVPAKTKLPGA